MLLCQCTVTLTELLDKKQYELRNTATNQAAGVLNIEQFSIIEKPTFIEYLQSGWQINLCVAIDYTASNGE